jgi:hypothetical protein
MGRQFNVKGATLPPEYQPHDGELRHLYGTEVYIRGVRGEVRSAYHDSSGRVRAYVVLDVRGGVQNGWFSL